LNSHDKSIQELIDACLFVGRDVPWSTQGAGSNFSVKSGGRLYIKGSGKRLDEIVSVEHLAIIDEDQFLKDLKDIFQSKFSLEQEEYKYSELVSHSSLSPIRASMETGFHSVLSGKFVLHFHSLLSIYLSQILGDDFEIETQVRSVIEEAGFSGRVVFLDYLTPGFPIAKALKDKANSEVVFLKNHGIILTGESASDLLVKWRQFELLAYEKLAPNFYTKRKAFLVDRFEKLASLEAKFPDYSLFLNRFSNLASNNSFLGRESKTLFEIYSANLFLSDSEFGILSLSTSDTESIQSNKLEALRRSDIK